jgi:hypothetical protein
MLPLICHHKHDKTLRAGICHDYEVFMATVGLETQPQPTVMALVTWDESFLNPEGEIIVPEDSKRKPAMVLVPAYELVFDGPYVAEKEEDDETQEAIMVADYVKEKTPEVYQQIIDALNADEVDTEENNEIA